MSLPGGIAYSVSSRKGTESVVHDIFPAGPNTAAQLHRPQSRRHQPQVDTNYRPRVQALAVGIFEKKFGEPRPGGVHHRLTRPRPSPQPAPTIDNAGHQAWIRGDPPKSHHMLSIIWVKFLRNLPLSPIESPEQIARGRLNEICRRTNTYIPNPESDVVQILVFADNEEDATRAVDELETFELDVRQTGPRPSRDNWKKTKTFDGRVEDRAARKTAQTQMSAARVEANKQTHFPFQAYLLWPPKVDLARFRKKHESALIDIQGSINMPCSIDFFEEGVRYVKISAQEEHHVHSLHLRVINLIKDMVAMSGLFSCINRLRLPRAPTYRDRVGLDKHPHASYFIPTLHGETLPSDEIGKWESLCKQSDRHNRLILRNEMETIIEALHAPGQQVRLRLTFTELGFKKSTAPADGSDTHTFDDFCEMLREPQTVMAPAGLIPAPGVDFGDLVSLLESLPEFSKPENRYVLHFDFLGSNRATLRLEQEMYIGIHGEPEMFANRWLQFSDSFKDNELLEFNMLDFEHPRANYQVHIGRTNIYEAAENDHITQFASRISYKPDPAGVQAEPKRRVVFPPGTRALVKHMEISIARFNFKGPDARFELIRKDIFEAGAVDQSIPSKTEWSAHYYYPEWDSLLGEFGNLKGGDQVTWERSMQSFFIPILAKNDLRPLPKTFGGFMNEAEQLQIILHNAIELLESQATVNNVQSGIDGVRIG